MSEQRNIVLVTVDSLRADRCGHLGGNGSTPTLDRLADEGLSFTNAIAPGPSTLDAMPVIFTGEEVHARDTEASVKAIHEQFAHHMHSRDTLTERLDRRGYETGAFTANPWTSRFFGFDVGFDHFEDFMAEDRSAGLIERSLEERGAADDSALLYAIQLVLNWSQETNMFQSWGSFYDDAIDWARDAEEPYFLWLFLVDVHMPYLPEAGHRRRSLLSTYAANLWLYLGAGRGESFFRTPLLDAYDDTVQYVDTLLGQLVEDLADDDPLVVVHADHGEEFGEHGVYGHGPNVYEEQVHSPLVVAGGPTGTIDEPFSLADLPELLVRLADGDDVTDLGEPVVRARNRDPKVAARGRDWKYIATEDGEELYDLTADEFTEIGTPELRELGRQLVEHWNEDETERRRIATAAREVTEETML